MAAYTPFTRPQQPRSRIASLIGARDSRRLVALTSLGWIFAAAVVLAMSVARAHASTDLNLGWESGDNSGFSTLECAHPSTQFGVVTSPVRDGKYAARFSESGNDVWSNGSVRCLDADYTTNESTGDDYYFGLSVFIPSGGISDNLIWELHQPFALYSISGCGVAPYAILVRNGQLEFRIITGDCVVGHGNVNWDSDIPIPNLNPYPRNQWMDFVVHIDFQESNTGSVQVWSRVAGNSWTSSPQISRTNIPTMPFCSAQNVHNVDLYTEMGLYPGYDGYTGSDTIYLDAYRRGTSFADVAPGGVGSSGAPTSTTAVTTPTTTATTAPTTPASGSGTSTTQSTTTVATTTSSPSSNGSSKGNNGKKPKPAYVQLLNSPPAPAHAPPAGPNARALTFVLQTTNLRGLRISLIDARQHRIPLLKNTRIDAVSTTYWRKTLSIGKQNLPGGRVRLRLRVAGVHLTHARSLKLRVQAVGSPHKKPVILAIPG